jgi:hypothetical protein
LRCKNAWALWEHENAYTDSLGTLQTERNFATGRASGGVKVSYPLAWSSTTNLAPYLGLYGDYYFSRDDATTVGLTTVPLRAACAAAIKMVSAITAAVVSVHLPAAEAWRLAGIWAGSSIVRRWGEVRSAVRLKHAWRWFDSPSVGHCAPRAVPIH